LTPLDSELQEGQPEELDPQIDSPSSQQRPTNQLRQESVPLPDDLMDIDSNSVAEQPPSKSHEVLGPYFGMPEVSATRTRPYGRVVLLIAVLTAVAIWSLGNLPNSDLFQRLGQPKPLPPSTTLVDSRAGLVLMLEQSGASSRVIVERADQSSWLLVSRDDHTAANPTLSPDATLVAYVTARDDGGVVVTSLVTDILITITAAQIKTAGEGAGFTGMQICPWTPVAWDPTNSRLAFFGCVEDDPLSMALVGDLTGLDPALEAVPSSKIESSVKRDLKWLDRTRITISTPATDSQSAAVTIFSVP
jgi:hypothetical protein